ncbi:hypothetical protein E2C06_25430 [Dankookia rubra]|uniref:MORN repeat-containing protein n=1 Tax=Dankookia rubra TaxID=1442381 RepID=A0A4R5Q9U8_9PROT|nr:hypothetical protein [Dankookia rubra]TDH59790.1 hypothetical protein E2C06_25430 [Dankookia rubra]
MVRTLRRALAYGILGLLVATFPSIAVERLERDTDATAAFMLPQTGYWRTRVQLMWNPIESKAVRRRYHLWDFLGIPATDVRWIPADLVRDQAGNISGYGRLLWLQLDSPPHLAQDVIAEYVGEMLDGMPHGQGRFKHRSGFEYKGTWLAGLFDGSGQLRFSDGGQYSGEFARGARQGKGVYIDAAGAVYDGEYDSDRPNGSGAYLPVGGVAFRALWKAGSEVPGSRSDLSADDQHFSGILSVQQQTDTGLRLSVLVDPQSTLESIALPYTSESTPNFLKIYPDDPRLIDVWRGSTEIQLTDEEKSSTAANPSFLGADVTRFQTVPIIFEFENSTSQMVGIEGAYLDIINSELDGEPAVQMIDQWEEAGFRPRVVVSNFGWTEAKNARLISAFTQRKAGAPTRDFVKNIGGIRPATANARTREIDFSSELAAAGVNIKALSEAPIFCGSRNGAVCLRLARASGIFGSLADMVSLSDPTFTVAVRGTLEYEWFDPVKKTDIRKKSPFQVVLPIGQLFTNAEKGEGGNPFIVRPKPYQLSIDRKAYRISLPVVDDVPPGVVGRWRFFLTAQKSSNHAFRLVLQLAGGREVRSREIRLLIFMPAG